MGREAGAQGGSACGLQTKWAVEREESAWDWSTVPPRSGTRAAGSVRTLRSRPFPARQPILVQFLAGSRARGTPSSPSFPFPSPLRLAGRKEGCCCVLLYPYCVRSECACVCVRVLSGRVLQSCLLLLLLDWPAGSSFFFLLLYPPPVAPHRRPLLFPSLHRESLTVSPPNRLVAESTDSLPSSPFLPSPLLYVLTTVTPLKSPLCAFPANSRSPFNPSGRPIYILSANAKIPPRLNPLHLALPCFALPLHQRGKT